MWHKTAGVVTATVLFTAILSVSFADDAKTLSSPPTATAGKVPPELTVLTRPDDSAVKGPASTEARIRTALDSRVRVRFEHTPLRAVCETIGKTLDIPVVLDHRGLKEMGVREDAPITRSMKDVRLGAFLDFQLGQLELTWVIRDEVLLITHREEAMNQLETRIYDVSDLLKVPGYEAYDFDSLIDLITISVDPTTWPTVGGPGPITPIETSTTQALVIAQSQRQHEDIAQLLADLRVFLPKGKGDVEAKDKPPKVVIPAGERKVRKSLAGKIDVRYAETPLKEVAADQAKRIGVEIVLDERSLEELGVSPKTPLTLHVRNTSAGAVLNLLLRQMDLAYTVQEDFLVIRAEERERSDNFIRVYDVSDLVDPGCPDFDSLIQAITCNVGETTWDSVGGPGSIKEFENAGLNVLVVVNTWRIHEEVERLLDDLRAAAHEATNPEPPLKEAVPGVDYPPVAEGLWRVQSLLDFARRTPLLPDEEEDLKTAVGGINATAFEYYARLVGANPDGNCCFSPVGVSSAGAILYAGARGETAEEIAKAMHFTLPAARLHEAHRLLLEISRMAGKPSFFVENHLWVREGAKVEDDFFRILRDQYRARCTRVDFAADLSKVPHPDGLRRTDANNPFGIRDDLVRTADLGPGTGMILVTKTFFGFDWGGSVGEVRSRCLSFHSKEGRTPIRMTLMKDAECGYGRIEAMDLTILEKPLFHSRDKQDIPPSLIFLLPSREPGSLAKLEAALSEDNIARWRGALRKQGVEIQLPYLFYDRQESADTALKSLGLKLAFNGSKESADFSAVDAGGDLSLGAVFDETDFNVWWPGDLGFTSYGMFGGGGGGGLGYYDYREGRAHFYEKKVDTTTTFRADHPFVYLVRDGRTGAILILGRFVGPDKKKQSQFE